MCRRYIPTARWIFTSKQLTMKWKRRRHSLQIRSMPSSFLWDGHTLIGRRCYSSFLSYRRAAISTTRHEPALWTSAPVVGVNMPATERNTAAKLMHIDKVMLNLIVLTVAFASRFRYGIFAQ